MKSSILKKAVSFFVITFQFGISQVVNEDVFPALPYKGNSADIIAGGKGFYITGRSSEEVNTTFDAWFTYSQPFFISSPKTNMKNSVVFPAVEHGSWFGLGGNQNRISLASVRCFNDSLFAIWSNIDESYGDISPFISFNAPHLYISRLESDSFRTIIAIPDGLHPVIAADNSNTLHFVWEKVTPLDSVWITSFSKYSSVIVYQNRTSSGALSQVKQIGKGYIPSILLKNSDQHVLFLKADSSNQRNVQLCYVRRTNGTFEPVVQLYNILMNTGRTSTQITGLMDLRWDVDDFGSVHAAWRMDRIESRRLFILHYSSLGGVQVDSVDDSVAPVRFLKNGEVKIFRVVNENDTLKLQVVVSSLGNTLKKLPAYLLPKNVSVNQILTDYKGNEHLLLQNTNEDKGIFVIKYVGTDSAKTFLFSKGFSAGTTSFVDSSNTVWLTGSKDEKNYLLSFSLDSVHRFQDFTFPLQVGNEWYYYVYPEASQQYPETDIQKAAADTVMQNGKTYTKITSKFISPQYYRKVGLQVFQYRTTDSTEHIRFDFSKNKGDTIWYDLTHQLPPIVLQNITNQSELIPKARVFFFQGTVILNGQDYNAKVTDSLGVTYKTSIGPTWVMMGARINGNEYGTILSVEENHSQIPVEFSLLQNYPNPFNPSTHIDFHLSLKGFVSLRIYDLLGREVVALVNELKEPGMYSVQWEASQFASGVYFAMLQSGNNVLTRKIMLLK